jgi:hypothetical protein
MSEQERLNRVLDRSTVICQTCANSRGVLSFEVSSPDLRELPLVKLTATAACQRPRDKRATSQTFSCLAQHSETPRTRQVLVVPVGSDSSQAAVSERNFRKS